MLYQEIQMCAHIISAPGNRYIGLKWLWNEEVSKKKARASTYEWLPQRVTHLTMPHQKECRVSGIITGPVIFIISPSSTITSRLKIRDKDPASHWFSEPFFPPGSQELFVFNTSWSESLRGPPSPYLFSSKCELGVLLCLEYHLVSKWFPQETRGCVLCRIQINMLQNLFSVWWDHAGVNQV